MKIEADRDICCSSGMCVLTAPDLFDQDEEDGRVVVVEAAPADEKQQALARQAEQLCPSRAISVKE